MSPDSDLSTTRSVSSDSRVNVYVACRYLTNSTRYVIGASPSRHRTSISAAAQRMPEACTNLRKLVPYKRMGEPEDIGRAAVRLALGASDCMIRTYFFLGGGMIFFPGLASGG